MSALDHVAEPAGDDSVMYTRCPALPNVSTLAHQLGLITAEFERDPSIAVVERIGADVHVAGYRYWLRHAGYSKPLWAWTRGADTRLIAVSRHESACPVYALPGSGIRAPADLKGRRIGVVNDRKLALGYNRIIYLQTYIAALARASLDLSDVEIVDFDIDRAGLMRRTSANYGDLAQSTMAAPAHENLFTEIAKDALVLLVRGEVDAIAANVPPQVAKLLDLHTVYDSRTDPSIDARHDLRCLVVSGALVRERRDLLVRIVARLLEAGRWALRSPEEAPRLLAEDLRVSEEVLRLDSDRIAGGMQILEPGEALAMLRAKSDLMAKYGFLDRHPELETWADFSILVESRSLVGTRGQ